jgi:heme-degrading monooxygenase HmoA
LSRVPEPIVTVQELRVRAGEAEAFLARFRELDVLEAAADAANGGLLDASLVRDGDRFLVVTTWAGEQGIDAWLASPARDRVRDGLEEFYAAPPQVGRYTLCATAAQR